MTTDEIKRLPIEQKIQIMEVLWEDLSDRFDQFENSDQHKNLLDERRKRVQENEAQLLDWDSIKASIGQ